MREVWLVLSRRVGVAGLTTAPELPAKMTGDVPQLFRLYKSM